MVYFQYLPIQSEQRKTFFRETRGDSFRSESEYRISERSKIEKTLRPRDKNTPSKEFVSAADLSNGDLFPEIRQPKALPSSENRGSSAAGNPCRYDERESSPTRSAEPKNRRASPSVSVRP